MKRLLAALLALLLLGFAADARPPDATDGAQAPRHAPHRLTKAQKPLARASGRITTPVPPPAAPACPGNRARDTLGRCPAAPACPGGRAREPGGQCPTIFCAGGAFPDAFGHCPAPTAPARPPCPGGGLRTPAGDCPLPSPCPGGATRNVSGLCPMAPLCNNGFTPAGGRCGSGLHPAASTLPPPPRLAPLAAPAPAPRIAPIRPAAPQIAPHLGPARLSPIAPHLAAPAPR